MAEKLLCTEHVVAFIDVLGAKNKISVSEIDSLNVVHNSYNESKRLMEMIYDKEWFMNKRPKVKIFSDNIVIYCPVINKDYKIAFVDVLMLAATIQTQFLDNGYLVRGAITSGSFFADEVMVWGKALVEAYNMEDRDAKYPRIIISTALINKIDVDKFRVYICKDDDGWLFVDYMSPAFGLNNATRFSILNRAFQHNKKELSDNSSKEDIVKKLNWQSKYITKKQDELIGIGEISTYV